MTWTFAGTECHTSYRDYSVPLHKGKNYNEKVFRKSGDHSEYGSYNVISLVSFSAILFKRIMLNDIRYCIETLLESNQKSFRKGRSTLEYILTLYLLIKTISAKKDVSLCANFVNITNAFYSDNRQWMFQILSAHNIPNEIVNVIHSMQTVKILYVPQTNTSTHLHSVLTKSMYLHIVTYVE